MLMAASAAAMIMGCAGPKESPAGPQVLYDGDNTKVMRFDNMHQARFIELFFATRDPKTGKLVAPLSLIHI